MTGLPHVHCIEEITQLLAQRRPCTFKLLTDEKLSMLLPVCLALRFHFLFFRFFDRANSSQHPPAKQRQSTSTRYKVGRSHACARLDDLTDS
jgi:hypothetical protein